MSSQHEILAVSSAPSFPNALTDPRGAAGARPPCYPVLSFSHTFLPKSARVGGRRPASNGSAPLQWEILDPPLIPLGNDKITRYSQIPEDCCVSL